MKVSFYELLGMIKDNKAPKKIKGRLNKIYRYSDYNTDYIDEYGNLLFYHLMQCRDKCLNDEVEIIEESNAFDLDNAKECGRYLGKFVSEFLDGYFEELINRGE